MLTWKVGIAAIILAAQAGCMSSSAPPDYVLVRFAGTVAAADGKPFAGATVRVSGFSDNLSRLEAVTGPDGRYYLEFDAGPCAQGKELMGLGFGAVLIAYVAGYHQVSSFSMGHTLMCVKESQTVNFVVRSLIRPDM